LPLTRRANHRKGLPQHRPRARPNTDSLQADCVQRCKVPQPHYARALMERSLAGEFHYNYSVAQPLSCHSGTASKVQSNERPVQSASNHSALLADSLQQRATALLSVCAPQMNCSRSHPATIDGHLQKSSHRNVA
jgi:hypothetical protein